MYPTLLTLGSLNIHTYGLSIATGFIVGLLVALHLGKSEGFHSAQMLDIGLITILCAIIGSRLAYVLLNVTYYVHHPLDIFKMWQGGLVFSGGLVAVALAMIWYLKRRHLPFWKVGDVCAPAAALGQAIGRMGCFMAGCCYGSKVDPDHPLGVAFPEDPESLIPGMYQNPDLSQPVCYLHPTQIYESLAALVIFFVLLAVDRRKPFHGFLLWLLIILLVVVVMVGYPAPTFESNDRFVMSVIDVITSGGNTGNVQIWEPTGKGGVLDLSPQDSADSEFCFGAAFSHDGRYVATSHHPERYRMASDLPHPPRAGAGPAVVVGRPDGAQLSRVVADGVARLCPAPRP